MTVSRHIRKPISEIIGKKFDRLTVISVDGLTVDKKPRALVRCDCGKEFHTKAYALRSGNTRSCGCRRSDSQKTHGMSGSSEINIWDHMVRRCTDQRNASYAQYGARGIKVCPRWMESFENFFSDMGPRPSKAHSIDRYPNKNGDYEPSNCRWATPVEQARNTRRNRLLTLNGVTRCAAEWEEITGISQLLISQRINALGWSVERALTTPAIKNRARLSNGRFAR